MRVNRNYSLVGLLLMLVYANEVKTQSAWEEIYNLFQSKGCAASGCHDGSNSYVDLYGGGSSNAVYNNITIQTPVNVEASAKKNLLVYPGLPDKSFLLRKIANNIDENMNLETGEGDNMPVGASALSNEEIELVRQWILYGAKKSGTIDKNMISEFYNENDGVPALPRMSKPTPPDSADGFQIHVGPVFIDPKDEIEFNIKYPILYDIDFEVTALDCYINSYSHHFILYNFNTKNSANYVDDGIRVVNDIWDLSSQTMVSAWAYSEKVELPEGAAYFWEGDYHLDLNYHLANYNTDSILAADVYLNIYYQPEATAEQEMHSTLLFYGDGGWDPYQLYLPNLNQYDTVSDYIYDPGSNSSWHVWMLSSHTHKYGRDYDIYKRNSDGSRGVQLYEGFYDASYTYNQGFYDWEHPTVRYFEPLEPVKISEGFIHEAVFYNYGTSPVGFGLTTEDEMMLFFVQYTLAPLSIDTSTTVFARKEENNHLLLYPNPAQDVVNINFAGENTQLENIDIYNALGSRVGRIKLNEEMSKGSGMSIRLSDHRMYNPGMYYFKVLYESSQSEVQKLVVQE